jgi:hypothetical protein
VVPVRRDLAWAVSPGGGAVGTGMAGSSRQLPPGGLGGRRERSGLVTASSVLPLCYRRVMAVRKKRSISMPPDLDAEIAEAAAQAGVSYSAWLADTARREFTIRAGLAAVSEFEHEQGEFTPAELAEAEKWAATAVVRARRSGARTRRSA